MSWLKKLNSGLGKTRSKITGLFSGGKLDDELLQDIEDALIMSDMGVDVALEFTKMLKSNRYNQDISKEEVLELLANNIAENLQPFAKKLTIDKTKTPYVVLLMGVNGSGKTTSLAKLGQHFKTEGFSQCWVAGDTFRAAAVEQLDVWANRLDIPIIKGEHGADVAALAYKGIEYCQNEAIDILFIDTAGRLQNKSHLMEELSKIQRVIQKKIPEAPHEAIIVIDANVGQNAISQVEEFSKSIKSTGLIITKLDGTARGGILLSLTKKFSLPIYAIGVGEQAEDLRHFDAFEFAQGLVGS